MSTTLYGSRWYKFDFHTHTPASSDYGLPSETEADWLKALMLAKVDCVAVTDHVSGAWIDRIKTTYMQLEKDTTCDWFRPLHIFPGCEITVSTGQSRVHILAIFDPTKNSDKITGVLGLCGITDGHGDAEETSSSRSVEDVLDIVFGAGGVAIPAHVDGPKGLLHEVRNTNQEIEKWLGKISAVEAVNLNFLDGLNPELIKACKHLAKVQGSDAHRSENLGSRYTWIKMGKPSIEGLKLALHDHAFCVDHSSDNPNSSPNIFLSELHIEKMLHCGMRPGHPAVFQLHPLFNAIIGGRGSGKSTFIESIRLALGREAEVAHLAPVKADVESFKNGVTRSDTAISVTINRRGEAYKSVWRHGPTNEIHKFQDDDWQQDHGNPADRFNVSIFSQKQINALATNADSLIDIIDRSAEVDIQSWRQQWQLELDRFLNLCRDARNLRSRLSARGALQAELADVESDIRSFEEGGHKEVFNAYQRYSSDKQRISDAGNIADIEEALNQVEAAQIPEFQPAELDTEAASGDSDDELKRIHEVFVSAIQKVKADAAALKATLLQAKASRMKALENSDWAHNGATVRDRYAEVVQEYTERGEELNPQQYEAWLNRRNHIKQHLKELEQVEGELSQKLQDRDSSIRKLYRQRRKLQQKRSQFIQGVIGENPYVRMTLQPFSSKTTVESQVRTHIGVETAFASSIYQEDRSDTLLHALLAAPAEAKSKAKEVEKIKAAIIGAAQGENIEEFRIEKRLLSSLQDKLQNQPEMFDRLSAWWPDDHLVVEYAKDLESGKFENIERGSAGQKAAAILAFLLSHGDNPIIVDQPEDDLDNALIYQLIVSQIHQNKKRRQIVMVTHNPNIVVNGDAEYVNVLNFRKGQVQLADAGGLCEQSIRESVCEIMEGGAAAFEKRYHRLTAL